MPGWTATWKRGAANLRKEPAYFANSWNDAALARAALGGELMIVVPILAAFVLFIAAVTYGQQIWEALI